MCVVSMINNHYLDKWTQLPQPSQPLVTSINYVPPITDAEITEFRELLKRAREYDKKNEQAHCEDADKKAALKKIAEAFGINISFIDEE